MFTDNASALQFVSTCGQKSGQSWENKVIITKSFK